MIDALKFARIFERTTQSSATGSRFILSHDMALYEIDVFSTKASNSSLV